MAHMLLYLLERQRGGMQEKLEVTKEWVPGGVLIFSMLALVVSDEFQVTLQNKRIALEQLYLNTK